MKIRLSKSDSISSKNTKNKVNLDMASTRGSLPPSDVIEEIDSYNVFVSERGKCERYRLILTIYPYCSNVLFNPMTEIVKNEGSLDVMAVMDDKDADTVSNAYGKKTPSRVDMIMNTEYSRDDVGYTYMPGLDIFNNHIIRNKTFRIVNKSNVQSDDFNTIRDYMRYMNGDNVKFGKRNQLGSIPEDIDKHLYLNDEIMSFEDSVAENLSEENGWLGFTNKSNIQSKKKEGDDTDIHGYKIFDELGINRVLNNREPCEFVDMYPDRTLYSFNPKINSFQKRLENNWDVILTYPYRNNYCHDLIMDMSNDLNALKMLSVVLTTGNGGNDVLLFRSYVAHGLSSGDIIELYRNGEIVMDNIQVTNIGNMSSDDNMNSLYYFYISDMSVMNKMGFEYDEANRVWVSKGTRDINDILGTSVFRIRKVVRGTPCKYYIRIFKRLPNLKAKKEELTDYIASNKDEFDKYIEQNATIMKDGNLVMRDFSNERYQLAFARTIYNDAATQITFTDTIDVEHLTDNLGRPIHEIYATVIKSNRGYKEWYGIDLDIRNTVISGGRKAVEENYVYNSSNVNMSSDKIEYSHCFGNLRSGFEMYHESDDDSMTITSMSEENDVTTMNEINDASHRSYVLETNITDHGAQITPDTENKDEFYGDIVEYSPIDCEENVLSPIFYRFNTVQRELPNPYVRLNKFVHDEIVHDDMDPEDFEVESENEGDKPNVTRRMEGYYYRAHYPFAIKEFGDLNQSAHYDIKVKDASPIQIDGIYISVTSKLSHHLSVGDIVYLCIEEDNNYMNDVIFTMSVPYVMDKTHFALYPYGRTWKEICDDMSNKISIDDTKKWNWISLSEAISNGNDSNGHSIKLRRRNMDIPTYAERIDHNKYLWRNLYRPGELGGGSLSDIPFCNDAFYISNKIDFFVKRQDPHGYNGLYDKDIFVCDAEGKEKETDNYYYKDDTNVVC